MDVVQGEIPEHELAAVNGPMVNLIMAGAEDHDGWRAESGLAVSFAATVRASIGCRAKGFF
ncbi:hypothetical protein AB9E19_13195 [Rhizobium leguminosarum]|uniref:hypothetical protein n=1 Tax=Rhizobium leguminosarum TaxID=384 RepID=UPI003F9E17B2